MKKLVAVIVAFMALAACTSTPPATSAAPSTNAPQQTTATPATSQDSLKQATTMSQVSISESVYFDFDQHGIKPEFMDALKNHVAWMKANKNSVLTLEGNADERGSRGYNLALGSKRAAAVHKMLVTMGIPNQRIKDVSFGKDKPRATCNEEKCWQENRRVDFVFNRG